MNTMLRYDREVWEVENGYDTDENSVTCRKAKLPRDKKAIDSGITHIQDSYGTVQMHETKRIK